MTVQNFTLPSSRSRVVSETGVMDIVWYRYFLAEFQALGSGQSSGGTAVAVPAGASPFTYTALVFGTMIISDGGISNVQFSRDNGVTFYTTGAFRGMFPLGVNDQLRVTYQAAPSMIFVPR